MSEERTPPIYPGLARRPDEGGLGGGLDASSPYGRGVPHVAGGRFPEPYDIKALSKTSITLTRCYDLRGPVLLYQSGDLTIALTGTDVYVCAKINTDSGEAVLSLTPDLTDPSDDSVFVNIPKYRLLRATTDDMWNVACDLRKMGLVLRI